MSLWYCIYHDRRLHALCYAPININLNPNTLNLYFLIMSAQNLSQPERPVSSPFMDRIPACRARMKKLRKKIYKNLKAKQSSEGPSPYKVGQFNVLDVLREERLPEFLRVGSASLSRESGLRDITNVDVVRKLNFEELRGYADEQEREVEQMLQGREEEPFFEDSIDLMSEQQMSAVKRIKSRTWLQSTEMECEDSSLMEIRSRISLRPFELFGEESQCVESVNRGGEGNGFLSWEGENQLQQHFFQF